MATISKEQFIQHMEAGWKSLGFTQGHYWTGQDGHRTRNVADACNACAIGAAAYAAKMVPNDYVKLIPGDVVERIWRANDTSDHLVTKDPKESAMKRVKQTLEHVSWRA